MGDSGSLLLGYVFNVFIFSFFEMNAAKLIPETYQMVAAPAVAFTVFIVPLFDTLRVMITRMKKRHSPFTADRNHVHHLMLSLGLQHRQVTFILMGISVLFIVLAIFMRNLPNGVVATTVLIISTLLTKLLWDFVDKKKKENLHSK